MSLQMWGPEQKRWAIIAAYYECLNQNLDFKHALADLFAGLGSLTGEILPWHRLQGDPRLWRAIRTPIRAFCAQWPLPPEAEHDLLFSFDWHQHGWSADELLPGVRTSALPTPGHKVVIGQRPPQDGRPGMVFVEHQPWIFPPVPLPFRYDPVHQSRSELRQRIADLTKDIAESIRFQAEMFEREAKDAGWQERPAHLRRHAYVMRVARRIYLRAVERKSWEEVAEAEMREAQDETGDGDLVGTARKTATRWARLAGIPLPGQPAMIER